MPRLLASLVLLAAVAACGTAALVAGCSSAPPAFRPPATPGLVAPLRGLGSSTQGKVRVYDYRDGIMVLVSGSNLPPNQFRVSFNVNGNCSSPNGFSAGPPWAPPGMNPYDLVPMFWNADGNAQGEAYVPGVHTTGENGVAGRSVVIYWGDKVTDAVPDVPNNRAACGVFEPVQPLF